MATETIRVSAVMPAEPARVYRAWLDGGEHSKMTGGEATVDPRVGGRFTAWDGYIEGETLELDQGKRVVQSWRSSEFPEGAEPSRIEVTFEPSERGSRITIEHTNIPEGQGEQYEQGWEDHYFEPMKAFFRREVQAAEAPAPRGRAPTTRARVAASAKKAAAKRPAKRSVKAAGAAGKRLQAAGAKKGAAAKAPAKKAAKPAKAGKGAGKAPARGGAAAAKKGAATKAMPAGKKAPAKAAAAKGAAKGAGGARKGSKPAAPKPAAKKAGRGSTRT